MVFCIMYMGVIILPIVGLILCRMVKKYGFDGPFRKAMEIAYGVALGLLFGIPGILAMILLMLMLNRKSKRSGNVKGIAENSTVQEALAEGAAKKPSMGMIDRLMKEYFGDSVKLVSCGGPFQMCVFGMDYLYLPKDYKITFECERSVIVVMVHDKSGNLFMPHMIYSEADYYHYEAKDGDLKQLVELVYKAISKNEIVFEKAIHK